MSKKEGLIDLAAINVYDEKLQKINEELDKFAPGTKTVHYDYFHQTVSDILGKVLTIIDASIVDSRQNKCVKDLIKQAAWKELRDVQLWYQDGSKNGNTLKPLILDESDIHP